MDRRIAIAAWVCSTIMAVAFFTWATLSYRAWADMEARSRIAAVESGATLLRGPGPHILGYPILSQPREQGE